MTPEEIRAMLVDKIGIDNLPQEEQDELIADTMGALMQRIVLGVMEKLTEEDQETLLEKMEDEMVKDGEIEAFLAEAFPGYEAHVTKETEKFFDDLAAFQEEEVARLSDEEEQSGAGDDAQA